MTKSKSSSGKTSISPPKQPNAKKKRSLKSPSPPPANNKKPKNTTGSTPINSDTIPKSHSTLPHHNSLTSDDVKHSSSYTTIRSTSSSLNTSTASGSVKTDSLLINSQQKIPPIILLGSSWRKVAGKLMTTVPEGCLQAKSYQ